MNSFVECDAYKHIYMCIYIYIDVCLYIYMYIYIYRRPRRMYLFMIVVIFYLRLNTNSVIMHWSDLFSHVRMSTEHACLNALCHDCFSKCGVAVVLSVCYAARARRWHCYDGDYRHKSFDMIINDDSQVLTCTRKGIFLNCACIRLYIMPYIYIYIYIY